jgi:hypothetical protein
MATSTIFSHTNAPFCPFYSSLVQILCKKLASLPIFNTTVAYSTKPTCCNFWQDSRRIVLETTLVFKKGRKILWMLNKVRKILMSVK